MRTAAIVAAACGALAVSAAIAQSGLAGYLSDAELPDGTRFIGPPPAPGTPAFAADLDAYRAAGAAKGGPAWRRAVEELDPAGAPAREHVACALGAELSPETTPATLRLLKRLSIDAEHAASRVKAVYKRPRPYAAEPGPVACDPRSVGNAGSPSYPSGSAASGWAWGLALAQIAPGRTAELLALGLSIGDNRVACRVHYPSDIAAGRIVGAAVFMAEQSSAGFQSDAALARAEIAKASPKRC